LVRREYFDTDELYSTSSQGLYYYTYGINYRAYIAGILINIVGFAGAVGAHVQLVATKMYQLNFYLVLKFTETMRKNPFATKLI